MCRRTWRLEVSTWSWRRRRLLVLAGRVLVGVAVPHRERPARDAARRRAEVRREQGGARPRLHLPRQPTEAEAPDERRVVAGVHGVAGVRGEGAGRGWSQCR